MAELLPLGTRVRFIGRAPGERFMGIGHPGHEHWLCGGVEAEVEHGGDGYPRHRCPDHEDCPDCVCGDYSDGWISEMLPWRVAKYPCECGEEVIGRAIDAEGEGISWERVIPLPPRRRAGPPVQVETDLYFASHGRFPRGEGNWAFDFVGCAVDLERGPLAAPRSEVTEFAPGHVMYSVAKRWAQKRARELGAYRVKAAP